VALKVSKGDEKELNQHRGEFAFDLARRASSFAKHGIDFLAAQQLLNDSELLEVPACTFTAIRVT
jgi:uncharacterized DUF497 family protein